MDYRPRKISVAIPRSASSIVGLLTLIVLVAGPLALSIINLILYKTLYKPTQMHDFGGRYFLLPWIVFIWLLIAGARYVKYAYGLRTLRAGFRYLLSATVGFRRPRLVVSEGKALVNEVKLENPLYAIGGPGYLMVEIGNVVALENYGGWVRVLGPGRYFVGYLERIKEVVSLVERSATVEKISATTKDGIDVIAKDVRYRYCLFSDLPAGGSAGRTLQNPYPYSEQAVIDMVYNRSMTAAEILPWHHGVNQEIDTVITDYIRQHQIDQVISRSDQMPDARTGIYERLYSESGRKKLKAKGAELLWIDIGYLGVPDKQVMEQRVSNWQTRWQGDANVVRAYGEAQRIEYQEKGRAEAQVDMILAMVKALEDVEKEGIPRQKLRTLYLARLGQLLETTLKKPVLPPGEQTGYV